MKFWLEYAELSGPANKVFEEDLNPQKSLMPRFKFRTTKKDLLEYEDDEIMAALSHQKTFRCESQRESFAL